MEGELRSTPREHARLGTEPIDGLRGFAVLVVVFYHTWLFSWINPSVSVLGRDFGYSWFVRPGFLGVEIFFVISAFCLAFPYVQASARGTKPPGLKDFALRRFLKIVPSYLIALVVTIAVTLSANTVGADQWFGIIWQHLAFVQNFRYDQLGNANSVLWSLGVEVQFYVAFPLLMMAFARRPAVTGAFMTAVALAYRYANAPCCLHNEDVMRLLPAYLDLFAIGMGAAWAVVRLPLLFPWLSKHRWIPTIVAFLAAWSIVAQMGYVDDRTYEKDSHELFVLGGRTLFGLAIGVCAAASCLSVTLWRKIVGNPVLTALSLVSYNVYLWHTLVEIWLAEHRIPYTATKVPHDDPNWRWPYLVISFATIAFISIAVTYFIERPILSYIKPQSFSYPWGRLFAAIGTSRAGRTAPLVTPAPTRAVAASALADETPAFADEATETAAGRAAAVRNVGQPIT